MSDSSFSQDTSSKSSKGIGLESLLPPQAQQAFQQAASASSGSTPESKTNTWVMAGNPNVGKSALFYALTGVYVNVSNFPGTTVDIPEALWADGSILKDSPGVYGLSGLSEEELVAQAAIESATGVINVVSATSLSRDLFLTQQLIDYQRPMMVVVNQMDEASNQGLDIDLNALSQLLGVPVYPCVATENVGVDVIRDNIQNLKTGHPTPDCPTKDALKSLESNPGERMHLYGLRRQHVNQLVATVTKPSRQKQANRSFSAGLGEWLLNPAVGLLALGVVLWALYQIVGVWIAGDLVDFTEGVVMLHWVNPALQSTLAMVLPRDHWFFSFLVGEFGLFTMSIQYIAGVIFPLVLGFYLYTAILEDSGYLPRVAVLSDTLLSRLGLNGRAVIPLILGFGCVTMATVSTRILTSQRERTIASTLLALTIPCSAQLAVIMTLMARAGGLKAWAVYLVLLSTIFVTVGTVLNQILPGRSTPLVLDLPPMRLPRMKNVLQKSWLRTKAFIEEATPLFVFGAALMSTLYASGWLTAIENALKPLTVWWLHLPEKTAIAFVMGVVRRDFGAAGLLSLQSQLSHLQILTSLMVITLFVPCVASAAVFWKERGAKEAASIIVGSWVIAFLVGGIVCRMLALIPDL